MTLFRKISKKIKWRLRFLNTGSRTLPNFLIIGASKSGTTSLWHYLMQHPCVLCNYDGRKEIQYFDQKIHKGLRWYKAHFPTRSFIEKKAELGLGQVLVGEATSHYIFHPLAPSRIKKLLPKVKIIALLRNPVKRAYSHYQHEVRKDREKVSFNEAIELEVSRLEGSHEKILQNENYFSQERHDHSYLERGKYYDQLVRWYDIFPAKQILVLKSEKLFKNPEAVYKRVLKFLGLSFYDGVEFETMNPGTYENMEPGISKRLEDYFYTENMKLYQLLKLDFQNAKQPSISTVGFPKDFEQGKPPFW